MSREEKERNLFKVLSKKAKSEKLVCRECGEVLKLKKLELREGE